MFTYTLELNSEQTREILKAVELLMRLKLNQPKEITRAIMSDSYYWDEENKNIIKEKFNDFIDRRDIADTYTEKAFKLIFPSWEYVKKDEEWYRLYNIYQVIRKNLHDAENPEGIGVDSYEPIAFTDEPLPKMRWNNNDSD